MYTIEFFAIRKSSEKNALSQRDAALLIATEIHLCPVALQVFIRF